jgi:cytoskeletal protein CcmA (bactofilin family)
MSTEIRETSINIIAESTKLEGEIFFTDVSRVHGVLKGEIHSQAGSTLILTESSMVEGNIRADLLLVDGYVRGNIFASSKVVISNTGRVIGNINAPVVKMEFGSYFEGSLSTQVKAADGQPAVTASPSPTPA